MRCQTPAAALRPSRALQPNNKCVRERARRDSFEYLRDIAVGLLALLARLTNHRLSAERQSRTQRERNSAEQQNGAQHSGPAKLTGAEQHDERTQAARTSDQD